MNKVLVVVTLDDTGHDNKKLWDNFCTIDSVKQHNKEWASISPIEDYTILFVRQTGDDNEDDIINRVYQSIASIASLSHLSIFYHKGSLDEKRLKKEIAGSDLITASFRHDPKDNHWKLIHRLIDTLNENGKNIENLIKEFFDPSSLKDNILILKYRLLSLWYPVALLISALKADIPLSKATEALEKVDSGLLNKSKNLLVEGYESLLKHTNDRNIVDFTNKILPLFGVNKEATGIFTIDDDSPIRKIIVLINKPSFDKLSNPWPEGWQPYSEAKTIFTFHEWIVLVDDLIDKTFDLVISE